MTDEERDALHKKLGIRAGLAGAIVAPPEDDELLSPLPEGFTVLASADELTASEALFDYVQFFARNRADLVKDFHQLRDKLAPGGSLWISWIKQSSVRGGGGLPGDLNENTIRRLALAGGLVDVKVASLDSEWSALKLVWRPHSAARRGSSPGVRALLARYSCAPYPGVVLMRPTLSRMSLHSPRSVPARMDT